MVQTPARQLTLAEFLALPDTKPASEYIDGDIIQKPMPQKQHSIIQKKLLFAIDPILSSVFIMGADRILQIIDEPTAILPVPAFARSIQLTVEQLFNWIKKQPQPE